MDYELIKKEFIELKKEELDYINNVGNIFNNKILSEYEKLKIYREIYRELNNYIIRLTEVFERLRKAIIQSGKGTIDNLDDVIIEIDLDDYQYKLTLHDIVCNKKEYISTKPNLVLKYQKLLEKPIYIFCYHEDSREYCFGPCCGEPDDYIDGIYVYIDDKYRNHKITIPKKEITNFEKGKTIIYTKGHVQSEDVSNIFEEELLNDKNKSINDCVIATRKRIDELNYLRSPEYKEKVLLGKINELYKKEKVIKNDGKKSVIVVAITQEEEYIITFKNRIKDEIIAEFPSGYIKNGEDIIEAANRELQEETGYISDDLFIVDEAFTSPGIDNSVTYIVIANNCIKTNKIKTNSTELVNYGLFKKAELEYLINNNIMNSAINKLAYYNLINNSNKKIYKMKRRNINL